MQEEKKKKVALPRVVNYIIGVSLVALGMAVMLVLRMGMSATASLPVTIYTATNIMTPGRWITIAQLFFVMASIIVTKKVKLAYGLSFVSVTIVGLIIDLFNYIFGGIVIGIFAIKILIILVACFFMICGVVFMLMSQFPAVPDLQFFSELYKKYNFPVGRAKSITDLTFVTIASIISYFIIGEFVHVGLGTIICALVIGNGVNVVKPLIHNNFTNAPSKNFEKIEALFEYDVVSIFRK